MDDRIEESQSIKIILSVQGFLLLLAAVFTFASDYYQSIVDKNIIAINSRFLELMQQENSISDSRLEFLEMLLLKDRLDLNSTQAENFNTDLNNVFERYKKKIDNYHPDEYMKISSAATELRLHQEKKISLLNFFSIISVAISFLINVYVLWKLNKFPLPHTP